MLRALSSLMLDQEQCRTKLLEAKALPALVAVLGKRPASAELLPRWERHGETASGVQAAPWPSPPTL